MAITIYQSPQFNQYLHLISGNIFPEDELIELRLHQWHENQYFQNYWERELIEPKECGDLPEEELDIFG